MELSYYPGCSLHGTSEEYDQSIRAICRTLDVDLVELEDWTCCGASSAHAINHNLATLLAARNLDLADQLDRDLLVPCAACYSRLKFAQKAIIKDPITWTESGKIPAVRVVHIHDLLAEPEMIDALSAKVVRPLEDLAVVPYYGCLTVRPPKIVDAVDPENPTALDRLLEALGARVVPWSYKTDCCGGSFSLSRPDVVMKLSGDLMEAALEAGGECLVTDCPMCQANLDTRQAQIETEREKSLGLPVFFITELIALALNVGPVSSWLKKHLVDPRTLLSGKGLL